jgi:hypothetical protein
MYSNNSEYNSGKRRVENLNGCECIADEDKGASGLAPAPMAFNQMKFCEIGLPRVDPVEQSCAELRKKAD